MALTNWTDGDVLTGDGLDEFDSYLAEAQSVLFLINDVERGGTTVDVSTFDTMSWESFIDSSMDSTTSQVVFLNQSSSDAGGGGIPIASCGVRLAIDSSGTGSDECDYTGGSLDADYTINSTGTGSASFDAANDEVDLSCPSAASFCRMR